MYILLLILGILLIALGVSTLIRAVRARTPESSVGSIVWGIVLIVLGIIAIPGGLTLR